MTAEKLTERITVEKIVKTKHIC